MANGRSAGLRLARTSATAIERQLPQPRIDTLPCACLYSIVSPPCVGSNRASAATSIAAGPRTTTGACSRSPGDSNTSAGARTIRAPRDFLNPWVDRTLAHSDEWFATGPRTTIVLHPPENSARGGRVLTFTSAVQSPWPENNLVHARLFAVQHHRPRGRSASAMECQVGRAGSFCHWLNRMGITVLRLSMPYHDRRAIPGHERADNLVGPNIGLTLQANRQAVLDARRCLLWLAQSGYGKLGMVGTSIGSAVGFITMAHDPLVRAGAFLHVSTYFADVVRTGMNTSHVWEGLRAHVSADELRRFWSPISPFPYVPRMRGSTQKMLMVSGRYDPTFWPEFSAEIIRNVKAQGTEHKDVGPAVRPLLAGTLALRLHRGPANGLVSVPQSGLSARFTESGLFRACVARTTRTTSDIFPAALWAALPVANHVQRFAGGQQLARRIVNDLVGERSVRRRASATRVRIRSRSS